MVRCWYTPWRPYLAVVAAVPWRTQTVVSVLEVLALGAVQAGVAGTLVHVCLTPGPRIARGTGAVETVHQVLRSDIRGVVR